MGLNFEKYQAEANELLYMVADELGTQDVKKAGRIFRAVLHAIRDRLPLDLSVQFGQQLPMIWKGIYFDSFDPSDLPLRIRNQRDWIDFICSNDPLAMANDFPTDEHVISGFNCVLRVLLRSMSPGQVEKCVNALPNEIKDLLDDDVLMEMYGEIAR